MINIDLPTLEAIKSLEASQDLRWVRFKKWLYDNADDMSTIVVHSVPDPSDSNFLSRHSTDRGMAIAFDVIRSAIKGVDEALILQKRIDEEYKMLQIAMSEDSNAMS